MTENSRFEGFSPDTFRFFMELGFNNEKAFMDANRERCKNAVQLPMRMMANELIPTALDIDPDFNTRMTTLVSRMNRDTRFSKNKLPYRDHAWMGFRHGEERTSESFCMYFEIEPGGYGYGMGMYGPNSALMKPFRERALADPARLAALSAALTGAGFTVEGEPYKKQRIACPVPEVGDLVNRSGISWCFFSRDIGKTFSRAVFEETKAAFELMGPLYGFVTGYGK